jgi:MtaA/CmuA family methyltransferase
MRNVGDMTSRERIDAVLRGDTPDRVPVFTAGHGITRHMLGVSYGEMVQSVELMSSCMLAWQDLIGDDRLMAYFDMMVEAAGFGQRMVYQDDQPAYSDKNDLLIKSPDDYLKLERYDVEEAERIRMTLKVAEILHDTRGDTVPVAAIVAEPMVVLGLLRGMEAFLMDCFRHPEEVGRGLEVVTDVVIDYSRALVKRGVSLIVNCHDYGNRSIMSEKLWLSLQGDCLRRMNRAIKETGATLIVHNCDSVPYIDAAFDDIGCVDVYQSAALPPSCSTWADYKDKYGSRAVLFGTWWPPEVASSDYAQVKAASRDMIEVLGTGGGFILGPTCEFPSHGPIANAKAMVDAAKEYGTY